MILLEKNLRWRHTWYCALAFFCFGWMLTRGRTELIDVFSVNWSSTTISVAENWWNIFLSFFAIISLQIAMLSSIIGGLLGYWLSPYITEIVPQRILTIKEFLKFSMFFLLWLVPMVLTGGVSYKPVQQALNNIPVPIRNQYRISCLFTHPSRTWDTVHYQVRLAGQLRWQEGPLEQFFDLDIFGYRSKLNRIVLASRYKDKQGKVYGQNKIRLEEMAQYIGTRWEELHPEDNVQEIRFIKLAHKVGGTHCMAREAWSRPPLTSVPESEWDIIHTVRMQHAP